MKTSDFRQKVEIWLFRACAVKIRNITTLIYNRTAEIFVLQQISHRLGSFAAADVGYITLREWSRIQLSGDGIYSELCYG